MSQVTLYHIPPSFFSAIARLALEEKGVAWHGRIVNIGPPAENYQPWYVRKNPRAVVPTLEHGERVVWDTLRIVRYVDETFEGPALVPSEPGARERAERWVQIVDGFPFRELSYGQPSGLLRHVPRWVVGVRRRKLVAHRGRNPDLAEAYDARIADVDRWAQTIADPGAIAALRERMQAHLDALEAELGVRPFIAGDAYSLADVYWTVALARLRLLRSAGLADPARHPRVAAWYERMKARPSFDRADVWERMKPARMVPIMAPYLLPRLTAAAALVGLVVWAL